MGTRYRTNFINSLSGPRVVHLIGTTSGRGVENLAIFSSVFHIGADPALLGMISRPDRVERHTLENIRESGVYTINLVTADFFEKAHQTSARYSRDVSEFDATGLTSELVDGCLAPFVRESPLKMALNFREEVPIELNGTHLIIGEIMEIHVDGGIIDNEGRVDVFSLDPIVCVGLDTYGKVDRTRRLSYAKP